MMTMLKLHFYFSRKTLVSLGISIAFVMGMLYYFLGSYSLNTFGLIFSLQMTSFGVSFYIENHFIHMLRTMPIATKNFVTSAYIFALIIISAIGIPIMLHQFYQSQLMVEDEYSPYFFLGFFAISVVHLGMQLKHYFTEPTKNKAGFDLLNFIFLFVVLLSPHAIIILFSNAFFLTKLGGFIIPILSVWIYYRLCQSAITKLEQAEL